MEKTKTLVITGANKGVGYSIIDGLLRQKNQEYTILLGSRNVELGEKALAELTEKHGDLAKCVKVVQLDINCEKSVGNFIEHIQQNYKTIDCLVNNAGVSVNTDDFDTKVFDFTFGVNVFDTIKLTSKVLEKELIPQNGKIIIIGSSYGNTKFLNKQELIDRFNDKNITTEKILELSSEFRNSIEKGTWELEGWPASAYCVSKICINKYAWALGNTKSIIDKQIQVYACCPGWVKTDLGGQNAERTLEEGSVTPVFLVNLKYEFQSELQGRFFYDEKLYEI